MDELYPGSVWQDIHLGTLATVVRVVGVQVVYEINGQRNMKDCYAFLTRYKAVDDDEDFTPAPV
jgi:hypothetical protein